MPRQLELDSEAVALLDQATAAVNRLGGVGFLLPNPHPLIGSQRRAETVQTSHTFSVRTLKDQSLGDNQMGLYS